MAVPQHSPSALQLSDVRVRFPGSAADVVSIDRLTVEPGQFVSILGASGSGKSTLLRLVAGLLTASAGQVQITADGSPGGRVGMVFQSPNLVPWRNARDNVLLPAELGAHQSVDPDAVDRLFRLVGFHKPDIEKRPAALSGGMQMRVSLARALVLQPSLLLLDEPFAALDDVLRMQLEEDVRRIHTQQSLTTVLVTHNISEAVFMSDRVLILGGSPSSVQHDISVPFGDARDRELRRQPDFHQLVDDVGDRLHAAAVGEIA